LPSSKLGPFKRCAKVSWQTLDGSTAPPSASKSRLHSFVTNDLEVDGVPSHAKAEKSFCNTGTLRGHRNNLYNYGRTGLATSEITETYKTKMESDGFCGICTEEPHQQMVSQ
jgi:hypothetical protein